MAKIKIILKLQIEAGKATPAPPIGPALGQHGLNIQDFCTKFNAATKDKVGDIIPVEVTIFEDRSFDFVLKTPPVASLIKKMAKIKKGAKTTGKERVGKLTQVQVKQIAEKKMPDLHVKDIEAAERLVEGTARSMGVEIES